MKVYIYALVDPRDSSVRYIGKTVRPRVRLREHRKVTSKWNTYKNNWIKSMASCGHSPKMLILSVGDEDSWTSAEQEWISRCRGLGYKLTNLLDGGNGRIGHVHSEESKEKMRVAGKKRFEDPVYVANISEKVRNALTGRKLSMETRAKLSASHKGIKHTWVHARGSKGGMAKLTESQVLEIREKHATGQKQSWLAREYGLTDAGISLILKRKTWGWLNG